MYTFKFYSSEFDDLMYMNYRYKLINNEPFIKIEVVTSTKITGINRINGKERLRHSFKEMDNESTIT